jgi:hypothetical protein
VKKGSDAGVTTVAVPARFMQCGFMQSSNSLATLLQKALSIGYSDPLTRDGIG